MHHGSSLSVGETKAMVNHWSCWGCWKHLGLCHYIATGIGAIGVSKAGVKTRSINHEHPFRYRILRTLESKPGLCYRELQSTMSAANGTLRHHLDVLQAQKSIQAIEVNGRLCYFAGSPQQFEDFRGQTFGLEEVANENACWFVIGTKNGD